MVVIWKGIQCSCSILSLSIQYFSIPYFCSIFALFSIEKNYCDLTTTPVQLQHFFNQNIQFSEDQMTRKKQSWNFCCWEIFFLLQRSLVFTFLLVFSVFPVSWRLFPTLRPADSGCAGSLTFLLHTSYIIIIIIIIVGYHHHYHHYHYCWLSSSFSSLLWVIIII